jgi:hypothetical protein
MLWASEDLRKEILSRRNENQMEAVITIRDEYAASIDDHLRALKHWPVRPQYNPDWQPGWPCPQTIVLRYDLPDFTRLGSLEIDILDLIDATLQYSNTTHIRVELVRCLDAEDQHFTVQLSELRHEALVALSNFSERFPMYNQGKGPRLWTDGKGVARKTRLVIDTTQIVVALNPDADKSLAIVRESAESILREVRHAEGYAKENPDENYGSSRAAYIRHLCYNLSVHAGR